MVLQHAFALEAERLENATPEDAIYRACSVRFRPIMMTTMAAMFGAVPLAIGMGTGSELRQPLGIAIVGGLIVSQALTLFTTPVVYLFFEHLRRWTKGMQVLWTLTPTRDGTRVEIVHDLRFRVPFLRWLAEPIIGKFFIENIAQKTLRTFQELLAEGEPKEPPTKS